MDEQQVEQHAEAAGFETLSDPSATLLSDESRGTFTGKASVLGSIARGAKGPTRFEAGAFAESLSECGGKLPLLWQHNQANPIGVLYTVKETPGGLEVSGRISQTQQGKDLVTLMKDGAVTGLSIGFDPQVVKGFERHSSGEQVRVISKARLHEVSLVTFPADRAARVEQVHRAAPPAEEKRPTRIAAPAEEILTEWPADRRGFLREVLGSVLASPRMIPRETIADLCPSCAERMEAMGWTHLSEDVLIEAMASKGGDLNLSDAQVEGLCKKVGGEADGFFTRCAEMMAGKGMESPEGFCASLHKACLGSWPAEKAKKAKEGNSESDPPEIHAGRMFSDENLTRMKDAASAIIELIAKADPQWVVGMVKSFGIVAERELKWLDPASPEAQAAAKKCPTCGADMEPDSPEEPGEPADDGKPKKGKPESMSAFDVAVALAECEAAARGVEIHYSPDQERDDRGRFAGGGGSDDDPPGSVTTGGRVVGDGLLGTPETKEYIKNAADQLSHEPGHHAPSFKEGVAAGKAAWKSGGRDALKVAIADQHQETMKAANALRKAERLQKPRDVLGKLAGAKQRAESHLNGLHAVHDAVTGSRALGLNPDGWGGHSGPGPEETHFGVGFVENEKPKPMTFEQVGKKRAAEDLKWSLYGQLSQALDSILSSALPDDEKRSMSQTSINQYLAACAAQA